MHQTVDLSYNLPVNKFFEYSSHKIEIVYPENRCNSICDCILD